MILFINAISVTLYLSLTYSAMMNRIPREVLTKKVILLTYMPSTTTITPPLYLIKVALLGKGL